jgi:signal transduction histidine kinase/DNA-binding NarL/FixJ family response regulator
MTTVKLDIQKFTILMVNDSPATSEIYRRYFLSQNTDTYQVLEVNCIADAIGLCQEHLPDSILVNFHLPEPDRQELVAALEFCAKTTPLPPILALINLADRNIPTNLLTADLGNYAIENTMNLVNLQTTIDNLLRQKQLQQSLQSQQQQHQILLEIAQKIRSAADLPAVLDPVAIALQQHLQCDRVIIYQLSPDRPGKVVAEAVRPQWRSARGEQIVDTCFQSVDGHSITYRQGKLRSMPDIYTANLSECYLKLLEAFQVKAVAIAPILLARDLVAGELPTLWGLAIAHQCDSPRQWQTSELSFLEQLSVQLTIAIEQSKLSHTLQARIASQQQVEAELRQQTKAQSALIQQLATTTELLRQRNQELDAFAAVASHDLRSPLRGIANLAQWLEEDLQQFLTPETRQQFDLLATRVQRMDNLVEDLLEYARLGRSSTTKVEVNVQELIAQIIDSLGLNDKFTIEIVTQMPTLTTDRIALQQVLSNLLNNAVKHHHRPDGRVEIFATLQGSFYLFEIVDDGPGIVPQDRERIFEVFQTSSQHDRSVSTGMGLAIVKKTIELQGGTIWLDSIVGEGSKFSFTWPIDPSES